MSCIFYTERNKKNKTSTLGLTHSWAPSQKSEAEWLLFSPISVLCKTVLVVANVCVGISTRKFKMTTV